MGFTHTHFSGSGHSDLGDVLREVGDRRVAHRQEGQRHEPAAQRRDEHTGARARDRYWSNSG